VGTRLTSSALCRRSETRLKHGPPFVTNRELATLCAVRGAVSGVLVRVVMRVRTSCKRKKLKKRQDGGEIYFFGVI